ncbi:unnamed protein product [Durusdinium trenchii]|uniref:EamA domain-containing protein n=1 Tax=Durusdinium trenchii TaxID=1381693 RepID=A0ABP0QUN7_9DINO
MMTLQLAFAHAGQVPRPPPALSQRDRPRRPRRSKSGCSGAVASLTGGALLCSQERVKRQQADRDSSEAEAAERLELIRAAIRRGEEKAAKGEDGATEPRRMTPEEEEALQKMFIQPEEVMAAGESESEAVKAEPEEPEEDLHEVRLRRTLEFCPDGKLAWEILQEIVASGERPGVGAFDLVMEAFSRRGALDDALAVFKAVADAGLTHSDASFDFLAKPASKSGEYRFVERLYAAKAQSTQHGQIGPDSLSLLLDAYANGLPRQAQKAQGAFRGEMAAAEAAQTMATVPSEVAPGSVRRALRRAVGSSVYRALMEEFLGPKSWRTVFRSQWPGMGLTQMQIWTCDAVKSTALAGVRIGPWLKAAVPAGKSGPMALEDVLNSSLLYIANLSSLRSEDGGLRSEEANQGGIEAAAEKRAKKDQRNETKKPSKGNLMWQAKHTNPNSQVVAISLTIALFAWEPQSVAIWAILRSRGLRVVLSASLFVAFLVATQLSVKVVESKPFNFKRLGQPERTVFGWPRELRGRADAVNEFPGLLTTLHFSCVVVAVAAYWTWKGEPRKIFPWSIPLLRWVKTVVPVAISQPISVVFNNKAMVYAGAGVCAVIGTLSPVCTAVISSCCGRRLTVLSWGGVIIAFLGALVISWGEVSSVEGESKNKSQIIQGLIYAFASLSGRCAKIVILDYMMAPLAYARNTEPVDEEPLSVIHVLGLTYPWGAVLSLAYALTLGGESPQEAWNQLTPELGGYIALSCSFALALNFLGTFALHELGASAQQIVGKLNTICLASISVAFLGEHLPVVVVVGSALVLGGVAIFERGQHDVGHEDDSDTESDLEESLEPIKPLR